MSFRTLYILKVEMIKSSTTKKERYIMDTERSYLDIDREREEYEINSVKVSIEEIKERIIELNFYLIEAINKGNKVEVSKLRLEIDSLIKLYLK